MIDASDYGETIAVPSTPPNWFECRHHLLMDGSLGFLRAERDIVAERRTWLAQPVETRRPYLDLWGGKGRLSSFDGRFETEPVEVELGPFPTFDRLADGRWLVAAAGSDNTVANGRLFTPEGVLTGAIRLGDAIEHIRCAPDGSVWVGWFDEGTCGDADATGARPIASAGIARFALDGTLLWSFNAAEPTMSITDSEAMTLVENTLWSCPYPSNAIARIENDSVLSWTNRLTGVRALAIDADHMLLAGGYDEDAGRIALVRLDDGDAKAVPIGQLTMAKLTRDRSLLVQGQGDTLHVLDATGWTKLRVADVRRAIADLPPEETVFPDRPVGLTYRW